MAVTNNFSASALDLNGQIGLSQPTALVWGPDGRLYVTEVDGDVKVLTVAFGDPDPNDADNTASFYVTEAVTISEVKSIPNFNDDGSSSDLSVRQVTGIDVTPQFDDLGNPVLIDGQPAVTMYVTSSDSRIGAGGGGADVNLDTNSGIITKLTQTGPNSWDAVDIVRGLARSEENHALNGLEVIQELDVDGNLVSERLIVANGGNANTGAPSNNFAGQQEQPYSAALLEVDLDAIKALGTFTDPVTGREVAYDMPTLNDPTREGTDDEGTDPFGGNDGFNSAKITADSPVQIYSPGYRNAYDVEVTDDGRVFTYDNGANNSWGGRPVGEAGDNAAQDFMQAVGYIATNLNNGDGNNNDDINIEAWDPSNRDQLHEATRSDDLGDGQVLSQGIGGTQTFQLDGLTYVYGGHPNPTRAEGSRAGLLFSPESGTDNAFLLVSNTDSYGNGGLSDYDEVIDWLETVELANPKPNPTSNIGVNVGDLTKKVIAVTPGVAYDIYSAADGEALIVPEGDPAPVGALELLGTAGLPADIAEIVVAPNPIEGDYNEAGLYDGSLDSGFGSINGLTEYTSTILDDAEDGTKMSGALIASQLNSGGNLIVIGRNEDGTVSSGTDGSGFALASDRSVIDVNGGPLGLAALGDNVNDLGLTQPFTGSIWSAVFKGSGAGIEIFQPNNGAVPLAGTEASDPLDNDLDGLGDIVDPFEFSAQNGYDLVAGQSLVLDFAPLNTNFQNSLGGTGFLGAALDGVTPNQDAQTEAENFPVDQQQDGLFNDGENILPGGNAPILQIKNVVDGSVVGSANTARDALQTGVKLGDDVQRLVSTITIKNWLLQSNGSEVDGQLTGLMFGDGTQSNFLRAVFGSVNGQPGIEVGYEINDQNYTTLAQLSVPELAGATADNIDLRLEIDIDDGFTVKVFYKLTGETDFTEVALEENSTPGFSLPAGVLQDVLTGAYTITDGSTTVTSGAAIGFLAEDVGGDDPDAVDYNGLDAIDILNLEIEAIGNEIDASTAAEVGQAGTDGLDTVLYDGTDTDLLPLEGSVEDFDGSASAANFEVTGNDLDNRITVGSGSNVVTTGAGSDTVVGTKASLSTDEITDFSFEDKVLVTDATAADALAVGYSAGSAILDLNGTVITFSGPDFENFDPVNGPATFQFKDTEEGLEISRIPPETIIYRINAGADKGPGETQGTIAAIDGGPDWVGDNELPAGVTLSGTTANTFSNDQTDAEDEIDPGNVNLDEVPWQVFAAERSDNNAGNAPLGFNFDVEAGTSYKITLFYTENWQGIFGFADGNSGNTRQFDVSVEGIVPPAFEGLNPAQEAAALLNLGAVTNSMSDADKASILGTTFQREFTYTATDDVLTVELIHDIENPKINAIQITQLGFVEPPVDDTAPEIVEISVENLLNVQDGTRELTVVLTDDTGFVANDFAGLDGSEITTTGIVADTVTFDEAIVSSDGKTVTLTYTLARNDNSWPSGEGEVSIEAGAYSDAAGNTSAATSGAIVLEPNLLNLVRGEVVRAINVGTTDLSDATDLDADPLDGGVVDNARYGGAIAADSVLTDVAGNPIDFEADNAAYYTSPKGNGALNNNVDGELGATGSNAGGVDLDGSALHTYRDSAADVWTATYDGFDNGTYVVELHFAELFHGSANQRVGDFFINGELVANDYDAFVEGGNSADAPSFFRHNVLVTDGVIEVTVDSSAGQAGYSAIVVYDAIPSDLPPTISVADVTTAEGEDATITFSRIGNLDEEVSVEFSLTPDTADASDYGSASPLVATILAGETTATVTLPIVDDELEEVAESLTVTITSVSNTSTDAVISDTNGSATVTIAASDSQFQAPVGNAIFDLTFDGVSGEALAVGGFDGALGTNNAVTIDEATSEIENGKLVVQTAEGDINDATNSSNASINDFTKSADVSDPALNDIFLTTRFDNPFTEELLQSQGITNGRLPNFVQQGIVFGTGTQLAGEQVKLVWGAVAAGTGAPDAMGIQMWSKGSGGVNVQATLAQMIETGKDISDVASVELSLAIDKAAGTVAPWVTLFDDLGTVIGGSRPEATPGFFTAAGATMPAAVLANLNSTMEDTHFGVTSNDNSDPVDAFTSFDVSWDFLNLASPQAAEPVEGPDAADGVLIGDFSDDGLAPTDIGVLDNGTTEIVAQQVGDVGPRDRDYFTFEVPEGQVLNAINLTSYVNEGSDTAGFIAIQEGTQIDTNPETGENFGNLLGGLIYGDGDGDLLALMAAGGNVQGFDFPGFDLPLEAGSYTLWLNQGADTPTTVTLDLVIADRPADVSLAIVGADDVVENGDFGSTNVVFELSASDNFSGDLEVTYDTSAAANQTALVTFTNGSGTLSVEVANDDINNGAETVGLVLTGANDPNSLLTTEVDSTSVTADVTEDDVTAEPVKGDVAFALNVGGPAVTGTDGIAYEEDTGAGWSGSTAYFDGKGGPDTALVDGDYDRDGDQDADDQVYFTDRFGGSPGNTMTYQRSGLAEGDYILTLKFAELYDPANADGTRVFTVTANGIEVVTNLDLFDVAELEEAYDVDVPVTVGSNGELNIAFNASADNAKINALVLHEAVTEGSTTDVVISVADVEADEDGGVANVVFTRDGDTTSDVVVTFALTDGTGVAGVDYEVPASLTVTIPAGQTTATVPVTLIDNAEDTETKDFTVAITDVAPAGGESASLDQGTATVTIDDDEDFDPADIDGDGIINYIDPLAYDEDNGLGNVLTVGGSFRQDFDVDTTDPFSEEAGFTGILVNTVGFVPPGTSAEDPYGDRTTEGNAIVEGGVLKVVAPESDTFGGGTPNNQSNQIQDNYLRGADVSGVDTFTLETKIANPFPGQIGSNTGLAFASMGLHIGAGGTDDWVKFVYGPQNQGFRFEFASQNSLASPTQKGYVVLPDSAPLPNNAGATTTTEVTEAPTDMILRLTVDKSVVPATLTATAVLLDSLGAELGTVTLPSAEITGSFAAAIEGNNPLTDGTGGIVYGIAVTEWSSGGGNGFTGEWDYVDLFAPDNAPEVDAGILPQVATENTAIDFVLPLDVFKDDNGVANLTLTATLDDDMPLPEWLSFDPETATFTGTPPDVGDLGENEVLTIKVTANDGTNGPVSTTFDLTIDGINGPFEWYPDADGDTYGANVDPIIAYESPGAEGEFVNITGDNDDNDDTVFPGAFEFNDGKDNDQDGSTDEDQVAPTVVDETATVFEDGALVTSVADLLSNDSDDNLDTLTFDGVSNPVNGVVDYNDVTGEIVFTPTAGFFGEASFDYSVSDGVGGVSPGKVTITVTEDMAPTVDLGIPDQFAEETNLFDFTLPTDAFADDGGVENLIFSAVVVDVIDDEEFEDELPEWLQFDSQTASFSGTPDADDVADLTIKVYANDGKNPSAFTTFTLSVGDRPGPFNWYLDADEDGFGDENVVVVAYDGEQPEGYVQSDGRFDNDDADDTVYPDAPEINDGKDNDQDGQTDEDNLDPITVADSADSLPNTSVSFTRTELLSNDSDPDGDALSFDIVPDSGVNGVVEYDSETGVVTFTPDVDFVGDATFDYVASDDFGGSTIQTVTINYNDDGSFFVEDVVLSSGSISSYGSQDIVPTGLTFDEENQIATLEGNTWKQFGLGEDLVITEGMKLKFTLNTTEIPEIIAIGLDSDTNFRNDPLAFFQLAGSQTLRVWNQEYNSDDTIVLGEDTVFEISLDALIGAQFSNLVLVNDNDANPSGGDSTFSNIQLLVPFGANAEPVAAEDNFNMTNDNLLVLQESALLENDTDNDGDELSIVSVGNAVNGSVSLVDGVVTFDPDEDYSGPASFDYTIADPQGAQSTTTVNIDVFDAGAGDVVTDIDFNAQPIESYGTYDGTPGVGFIVAADGESIALTGNVWKKTALPNGGYTITEDTVLRLDMTLFNTSGEIIGIGFENDDDFRTDNELLFQLAGTQNFTLEAVQTYNNQYEQLGQPTFYEIPLGEFAGQTFTTLVLMNDDDTNPTSEVTFANVQLVEVLDLGPGETEAPEIFGGAFQDQTLTQDAAFEIDLPFTDADTPFGDLVFTVANPPAFLDLVNGNVVDGGALTGTPTNADVGEYDVEITATDPEGNSTTGTMKIIVENVNDAPEVVGTYADALVIVNNQILLELPAGLFVDVDTGTQLIYDATGLPEGVSIDPNTGAISGTPIEDGDFDVTITAYDGPIGDPDTLSASTGFTLDVASGPPRETVLIEAEDFTAFSEVDQDVVEFFVSFAAPASGNQVIRTAVGAGFASVSTDLDVAGVSPGFYDLSIIHMDETDGASTITVKMVVGDGDPVEIGSFVMDRTDLPGQGNAAQAGNLTEAIFQGVNIPAGARLIIEGQTNAGELLRIDAVRLEPIDNNAPTISTLAEATVVEGTLPVIDVDATDPEGSDVTYAIVGGDDQALFSIDPVTGEVAFIAEPDFENPLDFDGDNVYDVIIEATDGDEASEQALVITVSDADEVPVFSNLTEADAAENDTAATTVAATDPELAAITYAIAGTGADDALFTVDPTTGVVTFLAAPDFETPTDADLDGVYEVSVTADDGTSASTTDLLITVTDENDAPVADPAPATQPVVIGAPLMLPITGLFSDQDVGDTLTYELVSGAPAGITGIDVDGNLVGTPTEGGSFDVVIQASDGIAAPVQVTLPIVVGAADNTFGPVAPFQDLDEDNVANSVDDDVDGDNILNVEDSFAYDANNGTLLADGESIELNFDVNGTPYQNGFTGLLQAGLVNSSDLKDFNEDTGNTSVANGLLTTTTTTGDTGNADTPEDDYQLGVKNADFTVEARVLNPFQDGPAVSFSQIGVHIGVDSTDFVKFVFGNSIEFSTRTNNAETKFGPNGATGNQPYPTGIALGDFASVDITLAVNSISAAAATVSALVTFLDDNGDALPGGSGINYGTATISGALAAALADETVGVGTGFTHVHAGAGVFDAQLDSFKVTATDGGTVDATNALEVFDGEGDIFTGNSYGANAVGSATLEVMTGNNNIQSSNFGANSFQLTNTGDKKIAAVFIDASTALYPDSVFDFDGSGGDNSTKAWGINSGGADTGAFITGGDGGYFLAGPDPLPNDTGTGIPSSGGFKGAIIKFTDFDNSETVGFSGDMDPNSIAGLDKGGASGVDTGATNGWDVGGISGHELIGSSFTVLFDDGTTASGQLASDGSTAGSQGLASESGFASDAPTLVVNGFAAGEVGTYGVDQPTILVTGDPGSIVRITMTKGFDPVENTTAGIDQLVEDRLDSYDFKVSNSFDNQTVDVEIGADGTFDATGLFDYDDTLSNGGSFAGSDVADIGFVASVVDPSQGNLPVSAVTQPIYLTNVGGPVVGDPNGNDGTNAVEIFEGENDLITDATYTNGEVGSAVLDIMVGENNIESSNFGANSFQVTNTGDKKISAVFIDVSDALYQDSVFDPDGAGGDNVAKAWAVNSDGGTGGYISGGENGYFLPGVDPLPNTTGTGQASNGGYKGAIVKFTDFDNGETVGFSGDMDPNSIAGLTKASVDGTAIDSWDVGGVSGHELIGSRFTVLFDDGTTASGQLASDGSASGSQALADQGLTKATTPTLLVNGVAAGGTGTYGGAQPTIIVTGDPGDTVRITLTKGFNPVVEPANGIGQLVEDRLHRYDFKANNNFDSQSVDVVIGQDGTFDATGVFDYDDAVANNKADGTFPGDDVAQIAFVASVIDTSNGDLAISDVTAPIVLTNDGGPVTGDPVVPIDGYFEINNNNRFKIQIEDENANGGTNPGGDWNYVTAPDSEGRQSGFQGDGYYLFGSDTSTAITGVTAAATLEYTIFIPDEAVGVYNFNFRASRDGVAAGDEQNDIWLNFKKYGTDENIEEYLTETTDEAEPTSQGFIKVFGGPNNGSWGFASGVDGAPGNFPAQIEVTEGGLYTVEIAGRSQGFHVDYFQLFQGAFGGVNAVNSEFIPGNPDDPVDPVDPGDQLVSVISSSSDDWEQFGGAGSGDLELGVNGSPQYVGLRFTDIDIPADKVIADAYFQFEANGSQNGTPSFKIEIEDSESAATYSGANNPDDRTYVDLGEDFVWANVEAWENGSIYRSPDISDLIEAAIGADGVADGELGFRITFADGSSTGKRSASTFDSDGDAPELVILFEDSLI